MNTEKCKGSFESQARTERVHSVPSTASSNPASGVVIEPDLPAAAFHQKESAKARLGEKGFFLNRVRSMDEIRIEIVGYVAREFPALTQEASDVAHSVLAKLGTEEAERLSRERWGAVLIRAKNAGRDRIRYYEAKKRGGKESRHVPVAILDWEVPSDFLIQHPGAKRLECLEIISAIRHEFDGKFKGRMAFCYNAIIATLPAEIEEWELVKKMSPVERRLFLPANRLEAPISIQDHLIYCSVRKRVWDVRSRFRNFREQNPDF